jgi:hypothetical protein
MCSYQCRTGAEGASRMGDVETVLDSVAIEESTAAGLGAGGFGASDKAALASGLMASATAGCTSARLDSTGASAGESLTIFGSGALGGAPAGFFASTGVVGDSVDAGFAAGGAGLPSDATGFGAGLSSAGASAIGLRIA